MKSYSLAEFFASTYQVPRYQRNYTWGEDEVKQLLIDLLDFNSSGEPFYLLGDVIAAATGSADFKYELIDGQQRSTTLLVLFAVLYRKLNDYGFGQDDTNQVFNALKASSDRLRVKMSGNASAVVIKYLKDPLLTNLPKETPSQMNVVGALEVTERTLSEKFPEDSKEELLKFTQRILENTYVGRLTLQNVDQATQFFERVNNRGVRLTSADLLKNRLLQGIESDQEYEAASQTWNDAERHLMSLGKLGSLEFLLRQVRQAQLQQKVQEKELFLKTKDLVKDEAGCLQLVELIDQKYRPLANILRGKTPRGLDDDAAQGTAFFGFTQIYGVKLAGSHLSDESFNLLSSRLEARAILSLLANERSQAFEREVPKWSNSVLALEESASASEIAAAVPFDEQEISQLLLIAHQFVANLSYDGTPGQVKRLRYVLAKANHLVNMRGPVENISLQDFLTTSRSTKKQAFPGFDIDHVLAQVNPDGETNVHSLGNLTLLHSNDNQSVGNVAAQSKNVVYGHSKCYLTRSLTGAFPQTAQVENIVDDFRVAVIDDGGGWGQLKMNLRSNMYWDIIEAELTSKLA